MMLKTINIPKIEFCECGTSKAQAMFARCMRENRSEIVLCPYCEQPMRANPPTQGESTMIKRYETDQDDGSLYEQSDGYVVYYEDHIAVVRELQSRLESLENEMQEQCRIIGMSAERELSLISKIKSLEKDAARYRWLRNKGFPDVFESFDKKWIVEESSKSDDGWDYPRSTGATADLAIDTAMQANKGE